MTGQNRNHYSILCLGVVAKKVIAIAIGIIAGPVCANLIDVVKWGDVNEITLEFTRVVIAVQVMAAGVSLPK